MLFCKGKIPRLKLCKTCRVPFVPDADVGTDDLTAEGCGAWSCVQGLAAVKRHGQVCADGSLGGLTRIGVDAAGQIDGQHECAAFPLTIHQRTGSQPGVHLSPYVDSIGFKELPGFLDKKPERTSVLQTLKEKCDAPECNPTVCRKARDAHEL